MASRGRTLLTLFHARPKIGGELDRNLLNKDGERERDWKKRRRERESETERQVA